MEFDMMLIIQPSFKLEYISFFLLRFLNSHAHWLGSMMCFYGDHGHFWGSGRVV